MREMTEQEIRDRQIRLLSIFKDFCEKNNITYFLMFGTLLGAIRHKGFIPWDNDIDLGVPREDYNRMIYLLKDDDSNPDFRFLCFENYPEYKWQHGRISDKQTYMKTAAGYSWLGLSVDIFPLDNQGNNKKDALKNAKDIRDCLNLRIMSYDLRHKSLRMPNGLSSKEQVRLLKIFLEEGKQNEVYWVKKAMKLATKFNKQQKSIYYGSNSDEYALLNKKEWYSSSVLFPFEGNKCSIPNGYDEVLKTYYGNYMIPPPEHERVKMSTTHIYVI